jgi:hypothetical protein
MHVQILAFLAKLHAVVSEDNVTPLLLHRVAEVGVDAHERLFRRGWRIARFLKSLSKSFTWM